MIEPRDLLAFSSVMMGEDKTINNEEAIHLRVAATSAYYSAYHTIKSRNLDLEDIPPGAKKEGVHATLINRLRVTARSGQLDEAASRLLKRISEDLQQAKEIRNHADYKLNKHFPKGLAMQAIRKAERIAEAASEL